MIDLDAARRLADEADERASKATPGPWNGSGQARKVYATIDKHYVLIATCSSWDLGSQNSAFVAAARSDVPALAALVRDMAAEIERLRRHRAASMCVIEAVRELDCDDLRDEIARFDRFEAQL